MIDWEIFNRPNKGSVNGFSHFAIRAEDGRRRRGGANLHSDLHRRIRARLNGQTFNSFGWGPRREFMTGLPHFVRRDIYAGSSLSPELTFADDSFPGQVEMLAFNPFIPTNDRDSSIPAAFFEYRSSPTPPTNAHLYLGGVLSNPLPANNVNSVEETSWGHALHLRTDGLHAQAAGYGDMTLATDAGLNRGQQCKLAAVLVPRRLVRQSGGLLARS